MANEEHINLLRQGTATWNAWRENNQTELPDLTGTWNAWREKNQTKLPDLSGVDLSGESLRKANLSGANLSGAKFNWADLSWVDFSGANLSGAHLSGAGLRGADLSGANLKGAILRGTYLGEAHLNWADFSGADLRGSQLIQTDIRNAILTGSYVYGISAWDVTVNTGTQQENLIITPPEEPVVMADNIKVAQFIYLLLNNEEIRDVIDTIGQKGVLILGRFTQERKDVLDKIRNRLRRLGFVPMMFDFERPTQRDFTETIKILAGLSRFIIADITNPASSPLELQAIMPDYMIPFVPIIKQGEKPFAMFQDLNQKYGEWVLKVLVYDSADNLIEMLGNAVVRPALELSQRLILKKSEVIQTRHVKDYMAGGLV